ncbi:MAG: carbon monoxide dehydrogenase subunit G [Acidobacteriota bacterium]|nr:carbon monoxide dehydrogenase subunit G [Acidobacteriota bacterium]
MKISGTYRISLPQQRAYELLQDPEVLAKCIPGCDELKQSAPDEYEMKMKMAISSVQGLFTGKVRIADQMPPHSFRLIVDGKGKVGFVKGEGVLTLSQAAFATDAAYEGDVSVGGLIAGVGQRLIDSSAKFIIKKFFENIEAAATAAPE